MAEIARARGGLRQSQPLPAERLPEMAAAGGEAGTGETVSDEENSGGSEKVAS